MFSSPDTTLEQKIAGLSPDEGIGQSHHGSDSNRPTEDGIDPDSGVGMG